MTDKGEVSDSRESHTLLLTPCSSAVDVTENQDGGILKELCREGDGDECPLIGDRVTITFDAIFADGNRFDSTQFRNENKFEFTLGKGAVVKAWDRAVATMKAGEKSRFYCKDNYVYTDETSLSTDLSQQNYIIYDIELLHWLGADISKRKDGGIRKSTLVKGEGQEIPNDGSMCEVHVVGIYDSRVFEDRDLTFILGLGSEAGLVSGVEMALKKFNRSEKSRLRICANYGYGSEGCAVYGIPPDAELTYEVEMRQFFRVKDHWEMDLDELVSHSEQFKQKGTEFFQRGKYNLARKQYKKIVQFLSSERGRSEPAGRLLLAGHLNLSICYVKLSKYRQARDASDCSLQLDPSNVKALYRRGLANLEMQYFDAAATDFRSVLQLEPTSRPAEHQLSLAVKRQVDSAERDRSTFAGMFKKFAQQDLTKDKDYGRSQVDMFSDIGEWSNELASGMMTLEQEMAAFGEKMPEPRYRRGGKENERPDSDNDDD